MKKFLLLVLACSYCAFVDGQVVEDPDMFFTGTLQRTDDSTLGTDRHAPEMEMRNGNGSLGQIYNLKKCGLDIALAHAKVGKRFTPSGVNQPAPLVVSGIPAGAVIEQAYLWASGSGNGAAQTATIVNPASVSQNFPMTIVGTGPDKCWGYAGSYTYRADITSLITGNGTYNVSGILTNPPTSGNDMDGIVMGIIYSDPCASFQGHVVLNDGMVVIGGGSTTQNINLGTGPCTNSTSANAFMYVGDLQAGGGVATLNGTGATYTWNWWNAFNVATTITAGQTNAAFAFNSSGDCFSMAIIGLSYKTTACATCGPTTAGTVTDPVDVNQCTAGGTANFSVTASGSTVLGYQWYVNTGSGFTALTNTAPYSGVNTPFLTISPTTAAMNGYQYQCVVDFCGPDVTSAPATLNVAAPPAAVCQDISITLSPTTAFIMAEDIDGGSTVSCGTPMLTASQTFFDCSDIGPNNVTLTVTDAFGATATCTAVVTVVDPNPPTINCFPGVTHLAFPGTCGLPAAMVSLITPTAFDMCDLSVTVTNDAPAFFPVGVTNVTWTATDDAGNTAACVQTVTITDYMAPSISCPGVFPYVSTPPGLCTVPAASVTLGTPTVTDDCPFILTNNAPATYAPGNTTVIWTATDASGNSSQCSQVVTVVDPEAPTITCPANISVNAGAGSCTAAGVSLGTPVVADNCSIASTVNNAPATFPVGTTNVTWTTTDVNSNMATCVQTVTVIDNQVPLITCPANLNIGTDAGSCMATAVSLGTPVTSDNCTVASVTNDAPVTFPLGITTVTWTVTDGAGNIATCAQTVTVTDNEDPTITCPANVSINTDAGSCTAAAVALGTPVTSDNCTVASVTNDAPAVFPLGLTTVTWTVTDGSGNTATCTQTVTVTDNEDPAITCPVNVNVNTDAGSCTASTVSLGTPITSDNCTVTSVTNDASPVFPLGMTTVTWTVTDGAGHSSTCTQTVTVADNEDPIITCPVNVSVNTNAGSCTATAVSLGTPTTSDNCTVAGVINDAPATYPIGITTVTWTVTDGSGNTATCTQTVTVTDNEDPTITCPASISINPDAGSCTATGAALGMPATSDNCTVASVTNDAPAAFPTGITNVTWTVTDGSGNTATCVQTVTVTDTENPVITCPANVSVNTDAGSCMATAVSLGTPVTSDNCTVASVTNDAPVTFPLGITTVTWTVTDGAGNVATCAQTVTVTDNEDPTITCPANVSINTDAGSCTAAAVALGTPVTSDNCTVASVTNDAPAVFPLGLTTVTWTVTDGSGNTATCTQTVTVADNEDPIITCPSNINVNTDAGSCTATGVVLGTPVTSDNCTVASLTNDAPAVYPTGITTVTWTVTDAAGNITTCAQTVTVADNEVPLITCPPNVSLNTDAGLCTATGVALGTPLTSDNCTIAAVTNNAPAAFPTGVTTVTWTVTDVAGNSATCIQTVTVSDAELPVAVCQDITVNLTAAGTVTVPASSVDNGSADNCGIASMTLLPSVFTCSNIGPNNVILTVTDNAGNTSTCNAIVTVGGSPLAITGPVVTDVACAGDASGSIGVTVTGGTLPLAFDWSNDGTGDTDDNEDVSGLAAGTYTLQVIDATSCTITQSFTVNEPTPIAITTTATDASCFGFNDGSASAVVTGGTPSYTYNWSTGAGSSTIGGLVAGTYTLTVTDGAGCIEIATVNVGEPAQVIPVITGLNIICEGESTVLTASGGDSYAWSTGDNTAVISVSPTAGTVYTVTATSGGCTGSSSFSITVNPLPSASLTGDLVLCPGETSVLQASGGDTYSWSNGTNGPSTTIDNADGGTIYVVAQNGCGADTAYATVINDSLTGVDAGPDESIGIGEAVGLQASGGGVGGYTWSPSEGLSCTSCENPQATPLQTTTYTVISENANGCIDEDQVTIEVDPSVSVLLPDIFTPNGNGTNDVLLVRGRGIQEMVFRIYDRWGQMVFESADQSNGWDGTFKGKPLDTGVFVYALTGIFYTGENFEKKGNITLKR